MQKVLEEIENGEIFLRKLRKIDRKKWCEEKNEEKKKTSTTPSCSGPISAQKSQGNSVLGVVFPHTMPKMVFHYSHRFRWEKNTLNWYITCHGYINIHHSRFIGPIKIARKFWKNTPLDHGGPEMKCTYFHRNCWRKKIA